MTLEFIKNMDVTEVLGMVGALIAVAAYFPQVTHLIRERCTAGLSRAAFSLWFLSSFLITIHALSIKDTVFISLGVAQLVLIAVILYYCTRYKGMVCPTHILRATKPRH
jgi:uncharacterized protein with PQ loop repeat